MLHCSALVKRLKNRNLETVLTSLGTLCFSLEIMCWKDGSEVLQHCIKCLHAFMCVFIRSQMTTGRKPTIPITVTASSTKSSQGGYSLTSPVKSASKCHLCKIYFQEKKICRGIQTGLLHQAIICSSLTVPNETLCPEVTLLPASLSALSTSNHWHWMLHCCNRKSDIPFESWPVAPPGGERKRWIVML